MTQQIPSGFEPTTSDPYDPLGDEAFEGTGPDMVSVDTSSAFDDLEAELNKTAENEPITKKVPNRPSVTLRFDTNIDSELIKIWRKKCKDKSDPDGYDGTKFMKLIIANKCTAVFINGVQAFGPDKKPLNFMHGEFLRMLKTPSVLEAVKNLYSNDGHLAQTGGAIMEAAGYAEEDLDPDESPTENS